MLRRIAYLIYTFFLFSLFSLYLFNNIKIMGGGSVSLEILALVLLMGMISLLLQVFNSKSVFLRKSFFLCLLFSFHYIFRIIFDIQDISILKANTVATTGGVFLFYLLGVILIQPIYKATKLSIDDRNLFKVLLIIFICYLTIHSIIVVDTYQYLISDVREDLFLLVEAESYQRPGTFLAIDTILFSIIVLNVLLLSYQNKQYLLLTNIASLIFYANSLMVILLSQLIGSNITLVLIVGIVFLFFILQILLFFPKAKIFLNSEPINLKSIFIGKFAKKLLTCIFISLFCLVTIFLIVINIFNIDLDQYRIFGFGSSNLSSISSRIELWKNFLVQFGVSPILGNMNVDCLTTGKGTYVHSFIGSLLTHLGLIGFSLFVLYIIFATYELFRTTEVNIVINGLRIYFILLFFGLFLIASMGVFITWIPIWFLIGLIFNPISLYENKYIN